MGTLRHSKRALSKHSVPPSLSLSLSGSSVRGTWKDGSLNGNYEWKLGLLSALRQGQTLISGLSPTANKRLSSFRKAQSRVAIGLFNGHNSLSSHFSLCLLRRRCGAEEETSAHVLCECKALASLRHTYLGSFSWTQRILRVSKPSEALVEEQGCCDLASDYWAQRASLNT
jgi:hypothetical protein